MKLLTEDYLDGLTREELEALINNDTLNESDRKKLKVNVMKRLRETAIKAAKEIGDIGRALRDENNSPLTEKTLRKISNKEFKRLIDCTTDEYDSLLVKKEYYLRVQDLLEEAEGKITDGDLEFIRSVSKRISDLTTEIEVYS